MTATRGNYQPSGSVKARLTPTRRKRPTRRHVDHAEFGRMVARLIGAYGRRVAGADMDDFKQLVELHEHVDQAIAAAVPGLRRDGYSWSAIGEAVGTTKQAAQQRWGRLQH